MNIQPFFLTFRQSPLRGVVFDFDGTLAQLVIDFDEMRARVVERARAFGLGPEALDGRYILEGAAAAAARLVHTDPDRAAKFEAEVRLVIETIEMEAAARGRLFPDTRPTLAALGAAGYRLAVITRNFGPAVRVVFPDIDRYCPVFLPREAVAGVKPDPVHLRTALEQMGLEPHEALMVGDHPIDIQTGRAVGTATLGVTSGRIGRDELAASGADAVLPGIGALVQSWALSEDQL